MREFGIMNNPSNNGTTTCFRSKQLPTDYMKFDDCRCTLHRTHFYNLFNGLQITPKHRNHGTWCNIWKAVFQRMKDRFSHYKQRPFTMRKATFGNLFTNMLITVWKTMCISTHRSPYPAHTWISTALLQENTQVLHRYMPKKDINLLILQQCWQLLTTGVKPWQSARKS